MTAATMIATHDPAMADDLLRLAAAADVRAELIHDPRHVRQSWTRPTLVLVGSDLAPAIADAAPSRRHGVVLVTREAPTSADYRSALDVGAQDLVLLPDHESWLIDAMASAAEPDAIHGTTICVTGARGGAGASVLAAALAFTATRTGLHTLLIDGDPLGGGLDLVLGLEGHEGARWPDLAERRGRLSASTLRDALPNTGDLSLLSWRRGVPVPLTPEATTTVLDAAARAFDLVVVDLPRYPTDLTPSALNAALVTYLLVPAEVRATVAANTVATLLRPQTPNLRLLVRLPAPGGLTPEAIAKSLDLPLTGTIPHDRRLPASQEEGTLPHLTRRGPLATLCANLLATLDLTPDHPQPKAA
ncbi:septum site-determining protein Ssd [Spirillospora sp. CA-294931]|uniref:septum site-determining protein Ssd n=1 Tax=Spirillospora sp. CA-294931 TaxID=3240042 RepID=UPI003D92A8A6